MEKPVVEGDGWTELEPRSWRDGAVVVAVMDIVVY